MRDGCHQHPHNPYIEWLAEAGLVGLIAYLVFIILLLWTVFPLLRGSTAQRCTGALIAGCLVLLLFPLVASQSVFSNWPALVFWTGLSMTMAVARLAMQQEAR
jgi:O-antigen ligase